MIDARRRARLATLAAITMVAGMLGGAAALAETDWRPDSWITAKAKIALATDDSVNAGDVNVDTVNSRVTLHGVVATNEAKAEAEKIARGIEGVTEVRNLLQVVAEAKQDAVERQDDEIEAAVEAALEKDDELRESSIDVQSVNKGVVLLGGSADSLLAHLEAIRTASRVDGVRRVETEVQTGDRLYDEKLWHDPNTTGDTVIDRAGNAASATGEAIADAGKATGAAIADAGRATADAIGDAAGATAEGARDAADATADGARDAADATAEGARDAADATTGAARSTTGAVSDAWITTSTKTRLLADADTPALSINVDTEDGVVTLFGTVPSEASRNAAIAHARAASGNDKVNDKLTIDPAAAGDDAGERPTDAELAERLRSEFRSESTFENAEIEVNVDDGVAELKGTAPSHEIKMAAATTARGVDGVRAVRNDLRIEPKI